jgi:hypothetical protein
MGRILFDRLDELAIAADHHAQSGTVSGNNGTAIPNANGWITVIGW